MYYFLIRLFFILFELGDVYSEGTYCYNLFFCIWFEDYF